MIRGPGPAIKPGIRLRQMKDVRHRFGEGRKRHRLGNVVDDFEPLTLGQILGVIGHRHHDDGKASQVIPDPQSPQKLKTAERRQPEIKKNGDEFLAKGDGDGIRQEIEGFLSVRDKFDVVVHSTLAQLAPEEFPVVGIVLDD